jgi:small-conductance mechanosensitive channel
MARGWESKSVESQMESAKEQTSGAGKPALSKEDKEIARLREGLLLSRKHVLQQIEASSNERYRQSLQQALNDINEKLAKLDGDSR